MFILSYLGLYPRFLLVFLPLALRIRSCDPFLPHFYLMAALVRPMNLRFPHLVTFLLFSYQFSFVSCVCHVNMAPPFVSEPLLASSINI